MKIISEVTGKTYSTVEECLNAEKKFMEEKRIKEEETKRLVKEKETRKKEIDEAYTHYVNLINKYIEDYGSFHKTYDFFPFIFNGLFSK